jgi:hypothetical protein
MNNPRRQKQRNRDSSDIVFVFAGSRPTGRRCFAPGRALLTRTRTLLATPTQIPQDPQPTSPKIHNPQKRETRMARIFGKIRMIQNKSFDEPERNYCDGSHGEKPTEGKVWVQ